MRQFSSLSWGLFVLFWGLGFSQDGGWSPWSKLDTPCQKSQEDSTAQLCGGGVRIRYRSCTMPVPQLGLQCPGSDTKFEACNTHACILPEAFMWSEWSECSKSCGRGVMKRHTMCGNVRAKVAQSTQAQSQNDTLGSDEEVELEYEEQCQSNQYVQEVKGCNTWNASFCSSPCDHVKCPAFSKCADVSNDTDPLYECICQLGTVKKEDGSSCVALTPMPVTQRPVPSLSPPQKEATTVVTRAASLLLITFLILTLVVFAVSGIWSDWRLIHMNMELSLLLAHVMLMPSGISAISQEVCRLLSIFTHYFFLVCFTFMFLEAIHLYSLVTWVVKSGGLMSKGQNLLFGWLLPLIILLFNLAFEYENYGGKYHCWLQMNTSLIYGQFVPIAFMSIITLAILEAAGDASQFERLDDVDQTHRDTAKIMRKTLALTLPTVLISFILGTLAEYKQNLVLYSIFTFVNGFLGILIFLCHCTCHDKFRDKIRSVKERLCLSKTKIGVAEKAKKKRNKAKKSVI